jgi:hypothetical protein
MAAFPKNLMREYHTGRLPDGKRPIVLIQMLYLSDNSYMNGLDPAATIIDHKILCRRWWVSKIRNPGRIPFPTGFQGSMTRKRED